MFKGIQSLKKAIARVVSGKSAPRQVKLASVKVKPRVEVNLPSRNDLQARLLSTLKRRVDNARLELLDAVEAFAVDDIDEDFLTELISLTVGREVDFYSDNAVKAFCALLDAISESECRTPNLAEISAVVTAIEDGEYTLVEDVDCDDVLGDVIASHFVKPNAPDMLFDYIDTKALGQDWRESHDGAYTQFGYIQRGYFYFLYKYTSHNC